jgi:metallophosphoesterase (TIGR00282 family)
MSSTLSILFLGDVVGRPGRRVVSKFLASAKRPKTDLTIVNVENSAHGFGLTEQNLKEFVDAGIDVLTGGNHTFDRKEVFNFIDKYPMLLRPANYPEGTPGRGCGVFTIGDTKVAVINLLGRVFMEPLRSPFSVADELVEHVRHQADVIFVDMHAEATAEKVAMGRYLDGRVSVVVGTHTHVQTADEHILPNGTAYITDAGCCAPVDSIIGMDYGAVHRRLVEQLPAKFEVASGRAAACGVVVKVDKKTGKAISIERVRFEEADESPAEHERADESEHETGAKADKSVGNGEREPAKADRARGKTP